MVVFCDVGKAPRHPRVLRGVRRVEPFDGVVVGLEELLVARHLLEALARDQPQHPDRVVRGRAPELIVEVAKHLAGAVLPAPPEVGGELVEAADSFGYGRKTSVPSHRTMDRSRPRSLASMKLRRYCLSAGVRAAIQAVAMRQPNASGDDRSARTDPLRNGAGLELAELRAALEKHHVDAGHPAAQMVGRAELADDIAQHHADGVGGAGHGEAEKGEPERVGQPEHDRRGAVRHTRPRAARPLAARFVRSSAP